jgi:hypothetical protein
MPVSPEAANWVNEHVTVEMLVTSAKKFSAVR